MDKDPENLIAKFVEELRKRQANISKKVEMLYPPSEDVFSEDVPQAHLPEHVICWWQSWVKQVPLFGFNSGKHDINMVKACFVKILAKISDATVAKKENSYMFLTLPEFKFLDIKNYLAPGLSYDAWCKAYGCKLEKLIFPYEWIDSFEKLNHVGPCPREAFRNSLREKITISEDEYKDFCGEFYKRKCVTMGDWLRKYNFADVEPFIDALDKTREQYYPDEIDLLKDAVSIPGISMTYVPNKALKLRRKADPDLNAPGNPCTCKCSSDCREKAWAQCEKKREACRVHTKNEAYELLTTGMIGGPSIIFCRYAEADTSTIRPHIYPDAKVCKSITGFDANALYLFCSGQEMPCGKKELCRIKNPGDPKIIEKITKEVLNDKVFGFFQVDIKVPEELHDKFSEFTPLLLMKFLRVKYPST